MRRPSATASTMPAWSTVLLVLLLGASLVLVAGRDISHRLTLATCTDAGDCGTFPDSPPVCEYFGRDRVVARESFAFAQQRPTEESRLVQFGDDSAEVLVAAADGDADVYSFLHWEDAQRWVLDHSAELGKVTNAAAGPGGQPIRDGYLRMLRLSGLDHEASIDPVASIRSVDGPSSATAHGMLRHDSNGEVTEVTMMLPLEDATAELRSFAAQLGLWGFLSYTVELDEDLEPSRLTFGGPATQDWSLAELRGAQSADSGSAAQVPPTYVDEGRSVLRSFVLDLEKQSNTALYREIFAMESIGGTAAPLLTAEEWISPGERAERYDQMVDRLRRDAVAVETTHELDAEQPTEELVLDSVEGLVVRAGSVDSPDTRLLDARSADLAISGSTFGPLLSCDPAATNSMASEADE